MSIFSRIKRVTTGKLELFLSKSENPEVIFPQLIVEMEEQVRAATDAEAKAMASLKQAEHAAAESRSKLEKMTAGAEAALKRDDESMAREAIEAQVALEAELIRREAAAQTAQETLEDARAARQQTQTQLQEIREKKDEILTRARVVQSQERIQRTVSGPTASSGSILDAVAAIESRVEEKEATLAVRQELAGAGSGASPSLERRIDSINRQEEIDRRMAALKEKVKTGDGHAHS
jgi:phage shock protein A